MTDRKRVVLVASTTGYQTQMFSEAADRAGIDLILATDRCHILEDPWGDHAIAIRFDDPDRAAELLEEEAGHINGIVAVGATIHHKTIPLDDTHEFGNHKFRWEADATGGKWARLAVWDVAGNGAFTNPIWR